MNFLIHLYSIAKNKLKQKYIVFVTFFFIFVFHLWSLMRFPPPFVDEVWLISRAWTYLRTGINFGQLDRGILEIFDGYWTFFPWFQTWLYSIGLKLAGAPLLLPLRLISLLFGFILLVAVFFISKRYLSVREAVIAVVLLSLSSVFSYSAHLARADIIVAALGFGAIGLYLNNSLPYSWSNFLSGLFLGIAIEIHPNAVIYLPILGIMYFFDYGLGFINKYKFWTFVGGLIISSYIYFVLHIHQYPDTFFSLMGLFGGDARLPPIFTPHFQNIINELVITGKSLSKILLLQILFVVWQIGIILKRKNKKRKFLVIIAFVLFLGFSFLIKNKAGYYLILIAPIFYIILASFLDEFISKPRENTLLSRTKFILVWVSVLTAIILNGMTHLRNHYEDYEVAHEKLAKYIHSTDTIMGSQTYWLDLPENIYYSWEQLAFYKSLKPTETFSERLEYFKPNIFIIDSHLDSFITDYPEELPYSGVISIPRKELFALLDEKANLISEYTTPSYGTIQVYRIWWDEE